MKVILLALSVILLAGCSSNAQNFIGQLQLEEGETGSVCFRGQIGGGFNPWATAEGYLVYREWAGEGVEAPEC